MAIKLADVIERTHVSFPVIEAHDKTIVGFYNGASSNAQQSLKLHYVSSVKTKLSSDGTSSNSVKLTSLPYGADGGADTAGPTDALVVPTDRGGILTIIDEKLLTDAQGQSTDYVAAYLVNVVNQGSSIDSARDSLGRLSELVQQFNRYESITGTNAAAQDEGESSNFYFAGYHDTDQAHKKISLTELAGGLGGIIGQGLVDSGIITVTQAGGSGLLGDLNGDGVVSVADFLLMNLYIGNGVTGFTAGHTIMSADSEESTLITPVSYGANSQPFALNEFSDWNVPSSFSTSGDAYGFTGIDIPSGSGANFMEFTGLNISQQFMSNYYGAYHVKIYSRVKATFAAPDYLYAIAYITLTHDDTSATEETHAYLMYSNIDGNVNLGAPSDNLIGDTPGVAIGQETEVIFGVDCGGTLVSGGIFLFSVATENDTDSLSTGFTMNRSVEGGRIEDVKCKVYFVSGGEQVKIKVQNLRMEINADPLIL